MRRIFFSAYVTIMHYSLVLLPLTPPPSSVLSQSSQNGVSCYCEVGGAQPKAGAAVNFKHSIKQWPFYKPLSCRSCQFVSLFLACLSVFLVLFVGLVCLTQSILSVSMSKGRVEGASGALLKQDRGRAQPFIPRPDRESVIVFSSAKKIAAATSAQPSRPNPQDSDSVPSPLPLPASSCASAPPQALPPPLPSLGGARGKHDGASSDSAHPQPVMLCTQTPSVP